MGDQCPICKRPLEAPSDYCAKHTVALRNIESAYPAWNKAYDGKLTQKDFFDKIAALPETGRWAKEVIQHLRTRAQ
jgi:hypothetical protein